MTRMTTLEMRMTVSDSNIHRIMLYLIFILCSAAHDNGASPIRRRMREQHESDFEDETDVVDVARQYFVSSMLVHVASCLILYVISSAVHVYTSVP